MKVIAITGGIGSGKSTLLKLLKSLDQQTLSADVLSRSVTSEWHELEKIKPDLINIFGEDIFITWHQLDRNKLAELVFEDKDKRIALEGIVLTRVRELYEEHKSKLEQEGCEVLFYEVPTLFEHGLEKNFDSTVLVTAPEDVRIERVVERQKYGNNKITSEEVKKRMIVQMPEDEKASKADLVYSNVGTEDEMKDWAIKNLNIQEKEYSLTFKFSSKSARDGFLSWLCHCGEQDYWQWHDCGDEMDEDRGGSVSFDYWSNTEPFKVIHDQGEKFVGELSDKEIFIPTKEMVGF